MIEKPRSPDQRLTCRFPYPFREATNKMRALEGPWSGDNDPFPREWTRGVAGDKVQGHKS